MDFVKLEMLAQSALADGFGLLIDDGVYDDPSQLASAVGMTMDDLLDLWHATDAGISYPVASETISKFTEIAKLAHADVKRSALVMLTAFNAGGPMAKHAGLALQ